MSGVNKAIILGHLGRDPELRYTQSGTAVCNLSVATSRKYKKNEEFVDETEWHKITVWGKTAEHCERFLSKGRQVYVEGRLETKSYDKDGVKHWSTQIVADAVQFLGGKSDSDRYQGGAGEPKGMSDPGGQYDDDMDIPF